MTIRSSHCRECVSVFHKLSHLIKRAEWNRAKVLSAGMTDCQCMTHFLRINRDVRLKIRECRQPAYGRLQKSVPWRLDHGTPERTAAARSSPIGRGKDECDARELGEIDRQVGGHNRSRRHVVRLVNRKLPTQC